MHGSNQPMATKNSKEKITPESARVGAEDGSSANNLVNNIGMEQTTNMMISIPEASTAAAGYKLQSCICG